MTRTHACRLALVLAILVLVAGDLVGAQRPSPKPRPLPWWGGCVTVDNQTERTLTVTDEFGVVVLKVAPFAVAQDCAKADPR